MNFNYLSWLYRSNPSGSAIGFNAFTQDGRLVGHYAVVPRGFSIDGSFVTLGLSLNTAVDPACQGQGLFTALAERTFSLARERGLRGIYGVANQNSTPGFIRRLKFHLLGPLRAELSFGRGSAGIQASGLGNGSHWDVNTLAWRLARPGARYRYRLLRGTDQAVIILPGKGLSQWELGAVKADLCKNLGSFQILNSDSFFYPALPKVRVGLGGWMGSAKTAAKIPDFLRPSPLNLIYRDLQNDGYIAAFNHFGVIDFDIY